MEDAVNEMSSVSGPSTMEIVRERLFRSMESSIKYHETEQHRREGCLEGLEIAKRCQTPEDFEEVLAAQEVALRALYLDRRSETEESINGYWRQVCALRQIEFVYETMKIDWRHMTDKDGTPRFKTLSAMAGLRWAQLSGQIDEIGEMDIGAGNPSPPAS